MATSGTVCAGSPVPFDPAEIDKKLAAAHTLNTLAQTTNRVVFDLYDRFRTLKLGEASAVAYVLLAILATLSYIQIRIFERR